MAPGLYVQLLNGMSLPRCSWHANSELLIGLHGGEISKEECSPLLGFHTYSHLLPALPPFRDCRTETGLFASRRPCGSAAGRRPNVGVMPMTPRFTCFAGSGGCTHPSQMTTVQYRIAQRPAMARSTRLAESRPLRVRGVDPRHPS